MSKTRLSVLLLLVTASCQPSRPVALDELNKRHSREVFATHFVTDSTLPLGSRNLSFTPYTCETCPRYEQRRE